MKTSSQITLDEQALIDNWSFLRSYIKEGVTISSVVKGNAYGHGIDAYVPMAEKAGVKHFSVFNGAEAYDVKRVASAEATIMIMGSMDNEDVLWAVQNEVEFFVSDFYRFGKAVESATISGKKAIIHIEAETGMYRTGFDMDQIPELIRLMQDHEDKIVFKGLCMHFAGAEHIGNYVRLKQQRLLFRKISKMFADAGMQPIQKHACCSAAAMRFPDMWFDMVRIGIMQYGFWSSPEIMVEYMTRNGVSMSPLKRVIRWESKVTSVKSVPAGAFIGYGSSYFVQEHMRIAIIPVGYAHGFSRGLSNTGLALIRGVRVPVVGTVNMNCIAVDITKVSDAEIEDEVVLVGMQGEQEISVASFGEMSSQLNYEMLTRLPINIPRFIRQVDGDVIGPVNREC